MRERSSEPSAAQESQAAWHERALRVMPDGTAGYSQHRTPQPLYLDHADGSRITDIDGREYIDYMLGAGPLVLGHRHPEVLAAVHEAVDRAVPNVGVSRAQVELAECLAEHVPGIEHLRFLPTGTEAIQAAIRIARKHTGRSLIAKFEGAYHGQSENVMVSVSASAGSRGSASAPERVPYHCLLPDVLAELTIVLPFNDADACERIIGEHAHELAAVLVEPMLGFAGAIPAERAFLARLRETTSRHGIVLVFDEVITGFRLALGGGQAHYGVTPDLTVLGKAIGGGMPIAAVGGSRDVMDVLSVTRHPDDYVFQSGTFSAFPPSVAAGLATLRVMERENTVDHTSAMGERVRDGLRRILEAHGVTARVTGVGSLFHVHFTDAEVRSAREAEDADQTSIRRFHERLLASGIYFYQGRLGFISGAHGPDEIGHTLSVMEQVLEEMANAGELAPGCRGR